VAILITARVQGAGRGRRPLAWDMTRTPSASVKGRSSGCSGSAPPPPPKLTTPSSPTCRAGHSKQTTAGKNKGHISRRKRSSLGHALGEFERHTGNQRRHCTHAASPPTSRRAIARQMSVKASRAKPPQPVSAMDRESSTATTTW
jgi:hypothetical protein